MVMGAVKYPCGSASGWRRDASIQSVTICETNFLHQIKTAWWQSQSRVFTVC